MSAFFRPITESYWLSMLIQPLPRSPPASRRCCLMLSSTEMQNGRVPKMLAKPMTLPLSGAPVYALPALAMAR